MSPISANKYFSAKPFFEYNYSPILFKNPNLSGMDYDNLAKNSNNTKTTPHIFSDRKELSPTPLNNIY